MRRLTSRLTRANVRITVLALIVLGAVGAIPATVASALPTSPPSDSEVSITVAGSGPHSELQILGTNGPDQIQIDQGPDGDAYVIEANRPIGIQSSPCRTIAADNQTVECRFPPGGFGVLTFGGADAARIEAQDYRFFGVLPGLGDDSAVGGSADDLLEGSHGDDRLQGGGGADMTDGGPGDDRLRGGDGGDFIDGRAGNDKLWGGDDADILTGGSGNDRCRGGPGRDLLAC